MADSLRGEFQEFVDKSADELHRAVEQKIMGLGFECSREFRVQERGDGRSGRVGLLVSDKHGNQCGIEIDANSPREKSFAKLTYLKSGIILLRKSSTAEDYLQDGVLVIAGGISLSKIQPITKKSELDLSRFEQLPSESVWADYLQHRKNKKAHLTQTALNRLATAVNEANALGYPTDTVLAECMLRNWQGFNAAWLENKKTSTSRRDELEAAWNDTSWANGLEGVLCSTLTAKINRQQLFVQPTENTINPQFIKLFNRFFESLKVIFPASISVLKTSAEIEIFKQQWITAFAENNINSDRHINAGLRIARQQKSPFLPSVGQFIDWCQQGLAEECGLPTPQQLSEKLQAYCRQRGHDDIHEFDYG